ncbi:hypothetical protein FNYG_04296 [Fusarium nygamai]|uniref:Uncharacterized protein n=1 Tax=Gibberella nygamai TaxID=42673 RepID=A0A2K0WJA8_GIBNY|nr:hypothetical protein FNYG_04296 [Fusarium nygamai]
MTRSIILTPFFLPQDSVKLGRFVTKFDHPHQNYHDPPSDAQPRALVSLLDSYTSEHQAASISASSATLTSLISAALSKRARMKARVATDHIKTYTLDNSDDWFNKATCLPATRAWIERAMDRGEDTYVIVGFHTATDASISQTSIVGNSAGGQIQVPVTLSLSAAGVVAPIGNQLDPGVGVNQQGLDGDWDKEVVGDQIMFIRSLEK